MRMTLSLSLLLAACGDDGFRGVWVNGDPFAECVAPLVPVACTGTGRSFALAICGDLTADNTLHVGGRSADVSLWVRDAATTRAPLRVDGNFWNASNSFTNTQQIDGQLRTGAEAPACTRVIEARAAQPWDVRIDEPAYVDLGACSYAQPNLQLDNTLEVHIHGDVTWVIDGDLHIAAPLDILLDPGAHLDWTIGGALEVDNTLTIEGPTTLNVGGPIHIAAPMKLDGSLIAPQSRVEVDNTLDVTGAAYVGSLRVASPMRVEGQTLLREDGCSAPVPGTP
jgi:hypothetical protein